MKKLIVFATFALSAVFSYAAQLEWGMGVSDETFSSTWNGATAYTYLIQSDSTETLESTFKGWTSSYVPGEGSYVAGSTVINSEILGSSEAVRVGNDTIPNSVSGIYYMVVVLEKDGKAMFAWTDYYVLKDDQVGAGDHPYFTEGGYYVDSEGAPEGSTGSSWIGVDSVPEPTVLALLALGVAGLALKRRVA